MDANALGYGPAFRQARCADEQAGARRSRALGSFRWWTLGLALFVAACTTPPQPTVAAAPPSPAPAETPSAPATAPPGATVSLAQAVPVDEGLRAEYGRCDATDSFRGLHFPILNARGDTVWYPCHGDPNRLELLVKLPATAASPAAVVYTSKLGLDLDGSWIACNKAGITDQCGTTLMLPAGEGRPCVIPGEARSRCIPVDADRVPYVVLPAAGPRGSPASEFMNATGIRVGDLGVVTFNDRVVPVIVADTGPFYKIGEGSMALHRDLGNDFCSKHDAAGNCTETKRGTSVDQGVTTIIFPGSAPSGLTPDNIGGIVKQRGQALYARLLSAHPK